MARESLGLDLRGRPKGSEGDHVAIWQAEEPRQAEVPGQDLGCAAGVFSRVSRGTAVREDIREAAGTELKGLGGQHYAFGFYLEKKTIRILATVMWSA